MQEGQTEKDLELENIHKQTEEQVKGELDKQTLTWKEQDIGR